MAAEDLVKDFLEQSNDQFIQQLFKAADRNRKGSFQFLVHSFLELLDMFHESYHISFELVSTLITWINSHRHYVIPPMQRGLTRLVHPTSFHPVKLKKSGKIDWLNVLSQSENFSYYQVTGGSKPSSGKLSFPHLLLSVLEEEVESFLSCPPHVVNSLVILLANCLNYEQQSLNDLLDLFYEKGFRTPFLEFVSGRSSQYSATTENADGSPSVGDASLGERVILYLCGALTLDLTNFTVTPIQVKYLAELCGSFSSLANLDAYNLNQFLTHLASQQQYRQGKPSSVVVPKEQQPWGVFVSKIDVRCLPLGALQVLVEHFETVPPPKMAAILAASARSNREKKFLKCLAEHFYLFSSQFVSLRSQALVRKWAESLSPKLKRVIWKDFLGGFLYSPFLTLTGVEEENCLNFSSIFHRKFDSNKVAASFDLETTDDADAFQEIVFWWACSLEGKAKSDMVDFLVQKFVNSSDLMSSESFLVLPLVVDSPNFSQSDLFSKFIRSFADTAANMFIPQESFWFLVRYLNSLESGSVPVSPLVLKRLTVSFFPELLTLGQTQTHQTDGATPKDMAKKGHGSGIQSEVIILFNAFLLKMRFPKSCFEIFPTSTFESEHFANISEAQMVFMCHLAIQYPTVFKGSNFIEMIQRDYTGSLSITDQLMKRLIRELGLAGVHMQLDPDLLKLSAPRMLRTITQWVDICSFMHEPSRCERFVELNVAFRHQWDESGTKLRPDTGKRKEKLYDPEFVLGILQKEIAEGTDEDQNGGRCKRTVHVTKFISSGRLSFLLLALSDVTPTPLVKIAKYVVTKFIPLLQKLSDVAVGKFFVDAMTVLRRSLKSELATLSFMQAHFYARLCLEVIQERVSAAAPLSGDKNEGLSPHMGRGGKFRRMSHRDRQRETALQKRGTQSDIVKGIVTDTEDTAKFPSPKLVDYLSKPRESDTTFNAPDVLFTNICEGTFGLRSFQKAMDSDLRSQFELIATSCLGSPERKWLCMNTFFGNIARRRDVLKMAAQDKHLDWLLFHIVDTRMPENDDIKKIARGIQTKFIEAAIFDASGRFSPLDTLLTPSKCSLYLEHYVSTFLQTPQFDANSMSERQLAVVITLMLGSDCSFHYETVSCLNLAKFLEKIEVVWQDSRSLNTSKKPSLRNFATYLRWTVSCCVEAAFGGIDEKQKLKFALRMKSLLKKVYFP